MQAPPVLPILLVAPLAGVTMLVVAGHLLAMRAARERIPASRYRIRSVNGGMMLALVPMLACAFAVVSPDDQKLFVLVWLSSAGLMGIVVVLAMIDGLNNLRLARREAERLRDEHRALMATLHREIDAKKRRRDG